MHSFNSLAVCLVASLLVFPFVKGWLVQRVRAFSKTLSCLEARTSGQDIKLLSNRQVVVFVSRNSSDIRAHLKVLQASQPSAIGLDAEWFTRNTSAGTDPAADEAGPEAGSARTNKHKKSEGRLSILQLSSRDVCLVIQLEQAARTGRIPSELRDLLSSASIIKAGVGIFEDAKRLQRDHGLECRGLVDLRSVAWQQGKQGGLGLKALAAECGIELKKEEAQAKSNWEAPQLTAQQVEYAAEDALAGLAILEALLSSDSIAPSSASSAPLPLESLASLIDVAPSPAQLRANASATPSVASNLKPGQASVRPGKGPKPVANDAKGSRRVAFATRKTPLYDNCRLLDPAGKQLCFISFDRMQWYVGKELADIDHAEHCPLYNPHPPPPPPPPPHISPPAPGSAPPPQELPASAPPAPAPATSGSGAEEHGAAAARVGGGGGGAAQACSCGRENVAIRLRFEPRGRGHEGNTFYEVEKRNECVACGSPEQLLRHYVVPATYRRHFPDALKNRSSHDILLLCVRCHQKADVHANALRRLLADECEAPISVQPPPVNHPTRQARSFCSALLAKHRERIPAERRTEMMAALIAHCQEQGWLTAESDEEVAAGWLSDSTLKKMEALLEEPPADQGQDDATESHGYKVVMAQKDLGAFIRRWRREFLDGLDPDFLPEGWDVDNPLATETNE